EAGGRLLSPSTTLIEIAGNKHATAEWLRGRGVPAPHGTLLPPGVTEVPQDVKLPIVVKPVDGCGSQGVRLLNHRTIDRGLAPEIGSGLPIYRIEEFIAG